MCQYAHVIHSGHITAANQSPQSHTAFTQQAYLNWIIYKVWNASLSKKEVWLKSMLLKKNKQNERNLYLNPHVNSLIESEWRDI